MTVRAAFLPRWAANTTYALNDLVVSPAGQVVKRKAAGTSGATFTASQWDVVAGGSGSGTGDVSIYLPGDTVPNPPPARSIRLAIIGEQLPDVTAPTVPANLAASAGDKQITYTWATSVDDVAVAGYRVFRGATLLATVTAAAYVLTGLTNDVAVTDVSVAAFDTAGNQSATATFPSATPKTSAAGPGLYFTDFTTYDTGTTPSDWTARWNTATPFLVAEDASAGGGKVLRFTPGGAANARRLLSWNVVDADPARADVEIVFRWRYATDPGSVQAAGRASGAAGAEIGYTGGHFQPQGVAVTRYTGSGSSQFGTVTLDLDANVWYRTRFRIVGAVQQIRTWIDGTTEPTTWTTSAADTQITAAGWVGLFTFTGGTSVRDWDWVGIASGGQTAPMAAV